ncbi:MAG: hypothetical protein WAU86_23490, partial [Oricola sp.]
MTDPHNSDVAATTDERLFFRPASEQAPLAPISSKPSPPASRRRVFNLPAAPVRRSYSAAIARAVRTDLSREAGLGAPFLFLPVALVIGLLVYFNLPVEPAPWNLPVALVALAIALLLVWRGNPIARYAVIAAFVSVAGMALAQVHTHWVATPILGSDVTTRLTG